MRAEREALERSLSASRPSVKPVPVRPGVTAKAPAALERGPLDMLTDFAGDSARSLLGRGTIGTGEGAVGLANIATALSPANIGARAASALLGEKAPDLTLNPLLDSVGYQPQVVRDYIAESDSEALKRARAKVEEAQGFIPTVEASLRNPSTIIQSAIESAPSMFAGQGIASGALKVAPSMAPILASAIGEGALTAGQNAEQTRQESGTLTPGQAGAAVAAGGVTAGISRLSGRLAEKMGIADPDTLILGGRAASEKPRGLAARMIGGAISEGLLEEAPQSAQEQAFQNLAQGRPLGQGVMESAAQGMLTGGLMGAGSNVMPQRQAPTTDNPLDSEGLANATAGLPEYDAEDDFTSSLLNPSIGPAQALQAGSPAQPASPAPPASTTAPAPSIRPSDVAGQIVWDAESQGRSPLSALIDSGLSTKDAKAVLSRVRSNQPQAAAVPAPDASKVDAEQDKAAAARRAEAKSPAPAPIASKPTTRNATPEEEDQFLREAHDAVNRAASAQLRAEREARAERFATPWDNRFASGAAAPEFPAAADPFGQAERNAAFGLASSGGADVTPAPSPFETKQEQFARDQSEQQRGAEDAFYRKYAEENGHAALVDALRTREGLSTSAAVEDAKAIEDGRKRKKRQPKPAPAQPAPAGAAPSDAAGTPTSPQAASSSPRDASAQAPDTQAQTGTVDAESSPASGTTERKTEPSPSSVPPPTSGESSDAVASPQRDDEGSTAAQESEQVDDTAAGNTDSSADGSTTVTARGRDFKVERTDKGFTLRGHKGARYDVVQTGPNRFEVKRNERRGMLGGRLGGPEDPLSGVTFAVKDGKLEVSNETPRSAPAPKVRDTYPGGPISAMVNSQKDTGPENDPERAFNEGSERDAKTAAAFADAEAMLRARFGQPKADAESEPSLEQQLQDSLQKLTGPERAGLREQLRTDLEAATGQEYSDEALDMHIAASGGFPEPDESGPQNPSGDAGGGGVESQPAVRPADKSALLEGPLAVDGAERPGPISEPDRGSVEQDRPAVGRDSLVADDAPKVSQGSAVPVDRSEEKASEQKPKQPAPSRENGDPEQNFQDQGTESLPPKPLPAKATTGAIEAGEVLRSESGRLMSPVPKVSTTSDRSAGNTLRRIDVWLVDEAKAETAATRNEFVAGIVASMNPKNLSPSDRDTLNDILFGDEKGPKERHRTPDPKRSKSDPKAEPKADGQKYKFSSTQADLPPAFAAAVRSLAAKIPDSALAGDGRASDPHVTVKFGTVTNDAADVRKVLEGQGPIKITFGKLSTFPPSESSDGAAVLKLDIYSSDLQALNKRIGDALENTETFKYSPHVTVAYVDPAQVDAVKAKLSNPLNGKTVKIDRLQFSDRNGEKHEIKLTVEPKGMDGLTKTQRAEKKAAPKLTLDGLTKDQIAAAEFDAQQLKRELAPLINAAVEENQTIHDALSPFYYNDLFGYNDSVAWADLPEATRKLAQRGGPPSRKLSMAERGKKAQGHKPGWVPPSYKQLRGLDLQVEDLVSLGWLPRGSTPSDLVDILLSDRPFYHPDGGSIDAKSQTTIAEENTIRTAQAVADETGIQPKAQLEALIRDKKNAKEVRILKALAKLDPNATQAQMDEARAKAEFEDAQEPDTVVEDTEPAPWDETQAEEPSFLKPQSAPKSKPAQKAMNVEKTAAGDQMLLPGGVAFGSNMERKKTEGREALGPLFQQEEEAAKKADAARQKSIGEEADEDPFARTGFKPEPVAAEEPKEDEEDEIRRLRGWDPQKTEAYNPDKAVFKSGNKWGYQTLEGSRAGLYDTRKAAVAAAEAHKALRLEMIGNPKGFTDLTSERARLSLSKAAEYQRKGMDEREAFKQADADIKAESSRAAREKADGIARAVAGGQIGANGEFYPGGTFLPSTDAPKGTLGKPEGVVEGPRDTSVQVTPQGTLAGAGLVVEEKVSKKGKTYWSVTGNTKEHEAVLDALGFAKPFKMGGKWYRSVFDADPTEKLAAALQGNMPEPVAAVELPSLPAEEALKVLRDAKIEVSPPRGDDKTTDGIWFVSGKGTYDAKDAIKAVGGKWDGDTKSWGFKADPTGTLAAAIKARSGGGVVGDNAESGDSDAEIERRRELRQREDSRPDERADAGDASELIEDATRALILRGEKAGIPEKILGEQIEDAGLIVNAYEKKKPIFLLANEAGTGKTMVLGAAIREMRRRGESKFVYVTMNTDLIAQIKKDLADYGVQDVDFHTYSEMSGKSFDTQDAILILDEAHNVKNVGAETARAETAQRLMADAKMTVLASATLFENPVEARYLAASGVFDSVGGFSEWAKMYGAASKIRKFYNPNTKREEKVEIIYWPGRGKREDGAAARAWLFKQALMTQRAMMIEPKMVDVQFRRNAVDKKWVEMYQQVVDAYDAAEDEWKDENGNPRDAKIVAEIARHRENAIKRVLEAAKVPFAIADAKALLAEGRNVVIFVETKADRRLGQWRRSEHFKDDTLYTYAQMQEMMSEWAREVAWARANKEKPPSRPFAEFIVEIARFFDAANIDFELPSTADQIVAALGEKNVAMYTGAVSNSAAAKNKADFLAGRKRVLVATMAKGGTGLSLHDTIGNRPTTQVNLNLPWKATGVDQVSARVARYGLRSRAEVRWLFASNIPWEATKLAPRVGARMRDMGAIVKGLQVNAAEVLDGNFDFEGDIDVKGGSAIAAGASDESRSDIYARAKRMEALRRKADDTSHGFFETPFPLAALMANVGGVQAGQSLLEPSGGRGALLRLLPDGVKVTAVEFRQDNQTALKRLVPSANVVDGDFMAFESGEKFDTVLMNPPFERKEGVGAQDVAHVMRAFDMLKPGGRLVAIMGEGAFFRDFKQEKAFREWLDDVGATVVQMPEGAFKQSGTGVRTRMVVIDKDASPGRTDLNLSDMEPETLRGIERELPSRTAVEAIDQTGFTFGDTFESPDGVVGTMHGHPQGDLSRVQLRDAEGKHLGYYSRKELKPALQQDLKNAKGSDADGVDPSIVPEFERKPAAATMSEAQWQHYNARHDADRGESAREAYRRSETVNGAPTGVRVVDFEGDVDKQVVSMMVQWSAAIASKMGAAAQMLQRHVPALKFGGVTPAGNLHGVNVDGKVFINYLATHQLALEVAKKERITYEEAFAREAVNVLIHEAAHYAEKGHGPAFEAEMDRIKADLGPQALASMLRDFRRYAANEQNRTRTQRMYEKAAPGWIEGERRGREAAANAGAAGARGADAQQSERLRPRPRSDTGGADDAVEVDEPSSGLRQARGAAPERMAGTPATGRPDGDRRVAPDFARQATAPDRFPPGDPRREENFRKWFGDSKVVDEAGEPLVVYHGTGRDFSAFKATKQGYYGQGGMYFSGNPEEAGHFAGLSFYGENIKPVYLSMQNPYLDDGSKSVKIRTLRAQGYDGIIADTGLDGGALMYTVLEPTQIKSATGNRGTFDPQNPDIRYSRKPSAPDEDPLSNVEETFLERMESKTRDLLNRFGRIQPIVEKSAGIKAKVDFQQHIQGITARAEPKLDLVKSVLVDQDAAIIAKNRLDFALAGDYAAAMDPKSKMSPEKRADAMKRIKASGKAAAYEQFRERTKHLQLVADSMRFKAGLDSAESIAARRKLRGAEWVESVDRQGKPAHPYLQALRGVERAVLQAERNTTMRGLADFVQEANLAAFGTVRKGAPGPDGVGFKVAGQQFSIDLKDFRLAQQIQRVSAKDVDALTGTLGAMTRYISRINTTLSPEFVPRNAMRDWMGAVFLGFIQSGVPNGITKSVAYKVAKGQIRAARGVFNYLKNPAASFEQGSPAWWVKQAFKNGAVPGYFSQVRSLAQQESELREALKDHLTGQQIAQMSADEAKAVLSDNSLSPQRKAFKYVTIKASEASRRLGFRKALDTILWANKIGEAATRANYYQAQVEEGLSPARAGDLTRNLFDPSKKAEWKAGMNAVWAFSHAAIEGAARVAELAAPDTRFYPSRQTPEVRRRAQGAMAALVAAGAAWATMLAMQMGDDDEDGIPDADQIPLYVSEKNLIVPGLNGLPIVIPFAQGFNVPFFAGQLLSRVARGKMDAGEASTATGKAVLNAFDPITTNYKMPTAISPLVDIAANEDVFGRKIGPTKFPGDPRPDSQMAMGSTSSAAKAIAQGLNRVTGGSDLRSGAIDIAPDSIEHLADFFAGGLGRFAQRVIAAGKDIKDGEVPQKIPGFSGWTHPMAADYRNRYYTQAQEVDAIKASVNQKEKSILQEEAREQFPGSEVGSLTLPELRKALQSSGVSAARLAEFQKAFDDRDRKLLSVRSKFQDAEKMLKALRTEPDGPEKEEKQREIWLAVNRAYQQALGR